MNSNWIMNNLILNKFKCDGLVVIIKIKLWQKVGQNHRFFKLISYY